MKKEISLADLESYLNTLLHPELYIEKAYNGVQVANTRPISKIATAVSVSLEVIKKTRDENAQAIIVHHGIFCKGDEHPLVGRVYAYVYHLTINNIALLCYHLPLDAHQDLGNNWRAAQDLGLKNCQPFSEYAGQFIGVIGEIEKTPFDAFKERVERYYGRTANFVKVKDAIKKVAIISGGADKYISEAAEAGADCFITGRVDEPVWDAAHEYGVSFLGLGHYGTEIVGPRALATNLEEHFQIPVVFIKTDNPF